MNKLINFEMRKLSKTKSFYISSIIILAFVCINILTSKMLSTSNDIQAATNLSGWSALKNSLSSGMVLMISGIFTALLVCEDETSGTLKNIYARGYSRSSVFFSKYLTSLFSIMIFAFISMASTFLIASILWGNDVTLGENFILSIVTQLLIVIAYHAIYFVISIFLGKVGSAIAINIVAPSIIGLLLTMCDAFIKSNNFKLSSYWLDSLFSKLREANVTDHWLITAIVLSIIYLVISLSIGYSLNQKKEI